MGDTNSPSKIVRAPQNSDIHAHYSQGAWKKQRRKALQILRWAECDPGYRTKAGREEGEITGRLGGGGGGGGSLGKLQPGVGAKRRHKQAASQHTSSGCYPWAISHLCPLPIRETVMVLGSNIPLTCRSRPVMMESEPSLFLLFFFFADLHCTYLYL